MILMDEVWDTVKNFEETFNKNKKKQNRIFYIPPNIVDYINRKVILENDKNDLKVIDLSCGSGIFLIDQLFKLKEKTNKSLKQLVEENIYGIDIDIKSVNKTRDLLNYLVLKYEKTIPNRMNIFNGNSLNKDILKLLFNDMKFDVVVGKPPYVKIQKLDEKTKEIIKNNWKMIQEDTNLYIPFIELGIELLEEGGKLGYIIPKSYFTSRQVGKLRELLKIKQYIDEILDFNHFKVLNKCKMYIQILILSKKPKKYFIFKKIKNKDEINELDSIKENKIYFDELNNNKWVF